MRPDDVSAYGFDSGERPLTEAQYYLGYRTYVKNVRPRLNCQRSHVLTDNKWIFYRLADSLHLPIPRTIGFYEPDFGMSWEGDPLRTPEAAVALLRRSKLKELVVKPVGGQRGEEVMILRDMDEAFTTALAGETRQPVESLFADLASRARRGYRGYVLQERIQQHPFFAALNPGTTNSMRIITIFPQGKDPAVLLAMLKMGRVFSEFEYWEHGGVAANISLETGTIGHGRLKPRYGAEQFTRHPDTGVPFLGAVVPHWGKVVEVCLRGARFFPEVRTIGWDVVATEEGPVILEANSDWGLQMPQLMAGGLRANADFMAMIQQAGISLPSGDRIFRAGVERLFRKIGRLVGRRS